MNTLRRLRPDDNIIEYTFPLFEKKAIGPLTVHMEHSTDPRKQLPITIVRNHSDIMINLILQSVTPEQSGFIFLQSELDVNPVENPMVPVHRLATPSEIQWLTEELHVSHNMLPVLPMKDPIRRWYNFPFGSVITIERSDKNKTDKQLYFRQVL